jgi:acyl dehydratase
MPQSPLGPYQVVAFNTAKESENKIHDNAVARRFGFRGGLVPGVEVYAYMAHLPVARWGRAWLERGTAECRLLKPVYDGDTVTLTPHETADSLDLRLESHGELCATGRAALPQEPVCAPAAFAAAPAPPHPPADRPPADEATLPVGTWLAIHPFRISGTEAAQYLRDVRESLSLYADEGLVHPGTILHIGNWALRHNVVLGPWMHVGSGIEHFAAARIGDELSARALVTDNYEHKGHRFVVLDVLVYANGATPVARIAHTAIYRPRQLAAA